MESDSSYLRAEEEEFDRLFTILMLGSEYQDQSRDTVDYLETRSDVTSALNSYTTYPRAPSTFTPYQYQPPSDPHYPIIKYSTDTLDSNRRYKDIHHHCDSFNRPIYSNKNCDILQEQNRVTHSPDDRTDDVINGDDLELFSVPLVITEDLEYLRFDNSTDSSDISGSCCQDDDGVCFVDDIDLDRLLIQEGGNIYYSTQDLSVKRDNFAVKRSKSFNFGESSYCDQDYSDRLSKSLTMDNIGLGDTIRMNTIKLAKFRKDRDSAAKEGNNNRNQNTSTASSETGDDTLKPSDGGKCMNAYQRYVGIRDATLTSTTTDDCTAAQPTAPGWNKDKRNSQKEPGIVDNILNFVRRTPKRDSKTKLKRYSWSPGFQSTTSHNLSTPMPQISANQILPNQPSRPANLASVTPRPPLPDLSKCHNDMHGVVNSRLSSGDGFIFSQDVRLSRRYTKCNENVPSKRHSCASEIMRDARSSTLERLKKDSLRYGLKNKLWESGDKLLLDLLDDLDDISTAGPDAQRRRRARDLFTDWLFSDAVIPSPTTTPNRTNPSSHHQRRGSREAFNAFLFQQGVTEETAADDAAPVSADLELAPHLLDISAEEDAESGYHTGDSMLQHRARAINAINQAAAKKQMTKPTNTGGVWSPQKVTPPGGAQPVAKPPPSQRTLNRQDLAAKIEAFNSNQHGLPMKLTEEKCNADAEHCPCYEGFIRVHIKLMRPISMVLPAKSPSLLDGSLGSRASLDRDSLTEEGGEVTSFYLPKTTTKAIHINSSTTAHEVIQILLRKYYITDNPHKFTLYEQYINEHDEVTLHRLSDTEEPLPICLSWKAEGLDSHQFVLQDNDTDEIMWDAFSSPELENFLRILNREENEYLEQVRSKYHLLRYHMNERLQELRLEKEALKQSSDAVQLSADDRTAEPVFV